MAQGTKYFFSLSVEQSWDSSLLLNGLLLQVKASCGGCEGFLIVHCCKFPAESTASLPVTEEPTWIVLPLDSRRERCAGCFGLARPGKWTETRGFLARHLPWRNLTERGTPTQTDQRVLAVGHTADSAQRHSSLSGWKRAVHLISVHSKQKITKLYTRRLCKWCIHVYIILSCSFVCKSSIYFYELNFIKVFHNSGVTPQLQLRTSKKYFSVICIKRHVLEPLIKSFIF